MNEWLSVPQRQMFSTYVSAIPVERDCEILLCFMWGLFYFNILIFCKTSIEMLSILENLNCISLWLTLKGYIYILYAILILYQWHAVVIKCIYNDTIYCKICWTMYCQHTLIIVTGLSECQSVSLIGAKHVSTMGKIFLQASTESSERQYRRETLQCLQ